MVDAKLLKGETKVLPSTRAKETRIVDPKMQISADEYREIRRGHDQQKSRYEQGETSRDGAIRSRVTSRILLNKWQWQKEKDYQRWLEKQEYQRQQEKERRNYLECTDQYQEFRQSQANHRSIHAQDAYHHNNMDQRLKMKVFIIGWEKDLSIKTGLIMEKKAMKENTCGRKTNGV